MSHNHHCHSHEHPECCYTSHEHHPCCHEHEEICDEDHHEHEDFSSQLLEMADDAWMELLMEKIKKIIEKNSGSQLDQLAELVAKTNKMRWEHKMAKSCCKHDFKEQIKEFFHKKCEK